MTEDPLIATSLLGAARLQVLPPAPAPVWRETWEAVPMKDGAAAMLSALALGRAARLAGRKSVASEQEVEVCAPETSPELSEVAAAALLRMLGGEFREVLPEWLEAIQGTGRMVPARVMPELLEAGRRDRSLRPALAALMGERGRWLGRRHEAFRWVSQGAASGELDWDADHDADRLEWLRVMRRDDSGQAVAALRESWSGEAPDFRQAVVQLVAEDPLPGDEAWLESLALKDRRQQTRRLAAAALMQLPGSAFAERSRARLAGCVCLGGRLRRKIEVGPPTAFGADWAVDGLREKPPTGTGGRAWWLQQIAAMVPLVEWPGLMGLAEKDLFRTPIDSDWKEALVLGWIESARSIPALALPVGLLAFLAELKEWPKAAGSRPQVLAALLAALPNDDGLIEDLAKRLPEVEMIQLLTAYRRASVGTTVRAVIRKALSRKPAVLSRPDGRLLALCVPLLAIQGELEWLARLKALSASAEEFATTLEFRRNLFSNPETES